VAKKRTAALVVGDLVARVEAPTVLHRVTGRYSGYVRVLPYRRSGKEQFLVPFSQDGHAIWAGDGSQWIRVGHD
jgi:hypothetical protein